MSDISINRLQVPLIWVWSIVAAGATGAFWVSTLEVRVSDMRPGVFNVERVVEINSNRLTRIETQIDAVSRSIDKIGMAITASLNEARKAERQAAPVR